MLGVDNVGFMKTELRISHKKFQKRVME